MYKLIFSLADGTKAYEEESAFLVPVVGDFVTTAQYSDVDLNEAVVQKYVVVARHIMFAEPHRETREDQKAIICFVEPVDHVTW